MERRAESKEVHNSNFQVYLVTNAWKCCACEPYTWCMPNEELQMAVWWMLLQT